jgi:DNA-binding NtrC family response regulator
MSHLLWVEDDAALRRVLRPLLEAEGYAVSEAAEPAAAERAWRQCAPELVLLDLMLPPSQRPEEGLRLLDRLLIEVPGAKVIVLTGSGGRDVALDAVRRGAHDLLKKPVDPDELLIVLKRARKMGALEAEVAALRRRLPGAEGELIGAAPPLLAALQLIDKVAQSALPVAIAGEPGTGKELAARRVHARSRRAKGHFVAVNCGAIPPTLIEGTLFGHERGAFTGADRERPGLFVEASGGTLFLDEVGDLPPAVQVALLRVLETGDVLPVGARRSLQVDVRVVSATNRDLGQLVKQGAFREDLYWRLRGVEVLLPPLRARGDDVITLAEHFLHQLAGLGATVPRLGPSAQAALRAHPWPGNLRELRHCVQRAAVLASGEAELQPEDLGLGPLRPGPAQPPPGVEISLAEAVLALEHRMITAALDAEGGNRSGAARRLGLSRQGLLNKLARHGLSERGEG